MKNIIKHLWKKFYKEFKQWANAAAAARNQNLKQIR